ncbi:MAG: O-antigen ligase family protein [Roseobacter sp.]|nr:O-antigen ligase family protein [Roseobacter sp.]
MIPPIAVILSWPVIVYLFCRGRGPQITLIVAVLGGYLFLPERININLPGLYELNKTSIPAYAALIACFVAVSQAKTRKTLQTAGLNSAQWLAGWLPRERIPRVLIAMMVLGVLMTILTNRDPVVGPGVFLPGQRLYDAGASILFLMITITPLLLARKFLAYPEGQRLLLTGFCLAGMAYAPLVLFEVRMSPQLNQWLYGFFAHSWIQHVRPGGGFRPIVFLQHGLRVSIFLTAAVLVTVGLARVSEGKARVGFLAAALVLLVSLVLSKSLGALMIALIFAPIMLFAPRRMLILAAACTATLVLLYPILRGTSLVPLDSIQNFASGINEKRGQSFGTRLYFEEVLLARAQERPFFGWGGWGRNLYIGEERAIPDGQWIIILGRYGWVGFLAIFGLLVLPAILLFKRWKKDGIGMETAVIAAALAASVIDLIPNSGLTPDKWLLAGALWGRLELGRISEQAPADPPPVRLGYKRARQSRSKATQPTRYTRQKQEKKRPDP